MILQSNERLLLMCAAEKLRRRPVKSRPVLAAAEAESAGHLRLAVVVVGVAIDWTLAVTLGSFFNLKTAHSRCRGGMALEGC